MSTDVIVIPPGFMRRAEFVALVYGWTTARVHAAALDYVTGLDELACRRALRCDPITSGVRAEDHDLDHDHPGWVANYLVVNPKAFVAWVLEMRRMRAEELLCA